MTYTKPELDVKEFNIVEEITADGDSAAVRTDSAKGGKNASSAASAAENSIGSDLIIG